MVAVRMIEQQRQALEVMADLIDCSERESGRATNCWGHAAHNVLPARSREGSVEGLFRGQTRRLPEVSRTLERFSPPARPRIWLSSAWRLVACSMAQGGALTLGPPGTHCMPRRLK